MQCVRFIGWQTLNQSGWARISSAPGRGGQRVLVGLKEAVFEPSPPQHIAELYDIIVTSQDLQIKPIMFMYTDSGLDHRLTYLFIQLSLISLFLKLNLDFLCLPYCSISFVEKPVESIMSILNLGFQSIGLIQKQVEEGLESTISKCNNMKQLRAAAEKEPELVDAIWVACPHENCHFWCHAV